MTNKQFEKLLKEFRLQQDKLVKTKGHDYTIGQGEEDRLFNFKWVAEVLGISPLQVMAVYWLKHILAILTFIKTGSVKSEGLAGRFLDENNYNLLGYALTKELNSHYYAKTRIKDKKKSRQKK